MHNVYGSNCSWHGCSGSDIKLDSFFWSALFLHAASPENTVMLVCRYWSRWFVIVSATIVMEKRWNSCQEGFASWDPLGAGRWWTRLEDFKSNPLQLPGWWSVATWDQLESILQLIFFFFLISVAPGRTTSVVVFPHALYRHVNIF